MFCADAQQILTDIPIYQMIVTSKFQFPRFICFRCPAYFFSIFGLWRCGLFDFQLSEWGISMGRYDRFYVENISSNRQLISNANFADHRAMYIHIIQSVFFHTLDVPVITTHSSTCRMACAKKKNFLTALICLKSYVRRRQAKPDLVQPLNCNLDKIVNHFQSQDIFPA